MNVGQFVAFNTYMVQLTWPIIAIGWVINIFQRGTASLAASTRSWLPTRHRQTLRNLRNSRTRQIRGELEFRHLSFDYNGTPVLKDINLKVPEGTSLAIVGPTGSGKINAGRPYPAHLRHASWQGSSGWSADAGFPARHPATKYRFRPAGDFPLQRLDSREHRTWESRAATDDQVHDAAEGANIAKDIESFPEGFKTMVGERGITLSGGQKQRTAIARAMIRNPKILVLDDALSSVDTYTEEKILDHLREVMQGRTTIFISHRVSTVRTADQIAVLHDGKIVELGRHEELLEKSGYYAELYNKQLLEEELETV